MLYLLWLPGLVLAFLGYIDCGLMTLLVLPLILICFWSLYLYQKRVFRALNLRVRKTTGFYNVCPDLPDDNVSGFWSQAISRSFSGQKEGGNNGLIFLGCLEIQHINC